MLALTVLEIAQIVGAELFGADQTVITGNVETDSRKVIPGSLF